MEFSFHLSFFVVFSIAATTSTVAKECDFPAIFNFGDSNSDTGGAVGAGLYTFKPPYGDTFFHKTAGRASDGRLIIDFIAQSFGLPYLNGYLDVGSNFSHGANFAILGATIKHPPSVTPINGFTPFNLDAQYAQLQNLKSRAQFLKRQGGIFTILMLEEKYFSKALYTFDIGSNDIDIITTGNVTLQQVHTSISDIVNRFSMNIKNIYNLGGRSFWIQNTGPLGCLPKILVRFPFAKRDRYGCAKSYNDINQYFNQKLNEVVVQLRNDLPLATIAYVDVYSIKYSLFRNPKKYGFEHPLIACCGYGGKHNFSWIFQCGDTIDINDTRVFVDSCEKPSKRVIWDGYHYTEEANKFIFHQISTGAFSDPPVPLNVACRTDSTITKHLASY